VCADGGNFLNFLMQFIFQRGKKNHQVVILKIAKCGICDAC
jgi:hypothetical protein